MYKKCDTHDCIYSDSHGCPECFGEKHPAFFSTVNEMLASFIGMLKIPEHSRSMPVVIFDVAEEDNWVTGVAVLWWDGGKHGRYYTYRGYAIRTEPVPDPRFINLSSAEVSAVDKVPVEHMPGGEPTDQPFVIVPPPNIMMNSFAITYTGKPVNEWKRF